MKLLSIDSFLVWVQGGLSKVGKGVQLLRIKDDTS